MLTFGKRLLLLTLLFVAGMGVAAVTQTIISLISANPTAVARIGAVMMDLFAFVVPAIVASMLITRLPADFLQINHTNKRVVKNSALAILCVIAAVPLINSLSLWNESISFGPLDQWIRQSEAQAAEASRLMLGGSSVASLILSILIAGVLAGFSEEIFFRGALQRILMTRPMNPHVAIWATAILFSAIHIQFLGFVPRLLLGAGFGYMAWWSKSVWPAVAAHVFNNSMVVTILWLEARGTLPDGTDQFGATEVIPTVCSLIFSGLFMLLISRNSCAGK